MKKVATIVTGLLMVGSVWAQDNYAISYNQADLLTPAGIANVHAKILKTAKEHCPPYSRVRDLSSQRRCIKEVEGDLVAKINHPALTAYANNPQQRGADIAAAGK